jgi:hypothetical protein
MMSDIKKNIVIAEKLNQKLHRKNANTLYFVRTSQKSLQIISDAGVTSEFDIRYE